MRAPAIVSLLVFVIIFAGLGSYLLLFSKALSVASPVNLSLPVVSGTAVVGQTLSTTDGTWQSGSNTPSTFAYQWERCTIDDRNCTPIPGATASTYVLTGADATGGHRLLAMVTASNSGGPTTVLPAFDSDTVHASVYRTFYVSFTNGSNTNNGTSIGTPWKFAPGMKGFAATYNHQAGDHFIFEGGDTWPNTTFPWVPASSGTATAGDYYGAGDHTWFMGASWSMPTFDGGANSAMGSFIDSSIGLSYVTWDGFHFTNYKWANDPGFGSAQLDLSGNNSQSSPSNFLSLLNSTLDHWAHSGTCCDSPAEVYAGFGNGVLLQNDMMDQGTSNYDSGYGLNGGGSVTVDHSTFFQMIQALNPWGNDVIKYNVIHDIAFNRIDYDNQTHSNGMNIQGGDNYIYNNTMYNVSNGTEQIDYNGDGTNYIFNNLEYAPETGRDIIQDDCTFGGCSTGSSYILNNTIQTTDSFACQQYVNRKGQNGTTGGGTYDIVYLENEHCVGGGQDDIDTGASITHDTKATDLLMSNSQATTAGYTPSEALPYSPSSATAATVGIGTNLTTLCTGEAVALCIGIDGHPRSTTGAWDIGAYQYSASGSGAAVIGDLDGNGHVNVFDLSILLSHWNQTGTNIPGDIDNNQIVNIFDLSVLLSHYGT